MSIWSPNSGWRLCDHSWRPHGSGLESVATPCFATSTPICAITHSTSVTSRGACHRYRWLSHSSDASTLAFSGSPDLEGSKYLPPSHRKTDVGRIREVEDQLE